MACVRAIKLFGFVCTVIVLLGLARGLIGSDEEFERGCKLQGTWYADFPGVGKSISTYAATSAEEGVSDLEWIDMLYPGLRVSSFRGVWQKSGHNKFDYLLVGFFTDYDRNIVQAVRLSGEKVLSDCNTMTISSILTYLDPNTLEPLTSISAPLGTARRITLQRQQTKQ